MLSSHLSGFHFIEECLTEALTKHFLGMKYTLSTKHSL